MTNTHTRQTQLCATLSLAGVACFVTFALHEQWMGWAFDVIGRWGRLASLTLFLSVFLGLILNQQEDATTRQYRRFLLLLVSCVPHFMGHLFTWGMRPHLLMAVSFVLAGLCLGGECKTAFRQLDIWSPEPLVPSGGSLLGAALVWLLCSATAPYIGAATTSLLFAIFVVYWSVQSDPLRSHMVSFAWGCVPAFVIGLAFAQPPFLHTPKHIPLSQHTARGKTYFVERQKSVGTLFVRGPYTEYFASEDRRFGESLVHPALLQTRAQARVLLIGGEDGSALREILHFANVKSVIQIVLLPTKYELFRSHPLLRAQHQDVFRDPRVQTYFSKNIKRSSHIVCQYRASFDAIIHQTAAHKDWDMYATHTWLKTLGAALRKGGRLTWDAGPFLDRRWYACWIQRCKDAGFTTYPYRSFGLDIRWTYVWMSKDKISPTMFLPSKANTYVTPKIYKQLFSFPPDVRLHCPSSAYIH